ncbi:MAG: FtsX-like permease family protein, partial [Vicinamibacterales bacterium]
LPVVAALAVASVLVLAIVCTNLANLVLARGVTRRGEIAVRRALGASRIRIVRLLLLEHFMLAVPAAAVGLLLSTRDFSMGAGTGVASVAPTALNLSPDGWVVACALLVACASTMLFGFLPALRASRVSVASLLKEEAGTRDSGKARMRGVLVVAQVAASLVLLVGAGLTIRTVEAARGADVGFDANSTVSVSLDLQPGGYDEARGRALYEALLERLRSTPGVTDAATAAFVPLRMIEAASRTVAPDGYAARPDEDMRLAYNTVSPGYFTTLRIPLRTGREFDKTDSARGNAAVIVNETMARRYWSTPETALGKRLRIGASGSEWRTVVGVVRDIKYLSINEAPSPYFYLPLAQNYRSDMTLHVRGSVDTGTLTESVRSAVHAIDPNLPILETQTLAAQARVGLVLFETVAAALGAFGVMAMALAAVGIFGLVSYSVRQREQEIGVRVALGARRLDVVRQFLWSGLRLGAAGAAAGVVVALVVTRLMAALLYGVSATDPLSFSAALLLVMVLTVSASALPAWRAARVDPNVTLRRQ